MTVLYAQVRRVGGDLLEELRGSFHLRLLAGWLLLAVLVGLFLTAVLVEPSLAASQASKNVSDEAGAWAKGLLLVVVALVAIPVIAKLDLGKGVTLFLLAVVLGGFAYAQPEVRGMIADIWRSI